jgi:hypothetical protein
MHARARRAVQRLVGDMADTTGTAWDEGHHQPLPRWRGR